MSEVQVNLRIPREVKEKIQNIAKLNNRSLNAELNERLYTSLNSPIDFEIPMNMLRELLALHEESPRQKEIAEKLNFLLSEHNEVTNRKFTVSKIAYDMGFDTATDVERWFLGQIEPSFSQLERLANFFGCSKQWLSFSQGKAFPSIRYGIPEKVEEFFNFYIQPDAILGEVTQLSFIRARTEVGELAIIKYFSNSRCQVYQTEISLNAAINAVNEKKLLILMLTLEALYSNNWGSKVDSYLLREEAYSQIISGDQHPLKILSEYNTTAWAKDIFTIDKNDSISVNYWDGWGALKQTIEKILI